MASTDAQAALHRALELFMDEDPVGALGALDEAIALGAEPVAQVLARRSAVLAKLRRFDDARRDAEAALKHDPELAMALFRIGVASFGLDDFAGARDAFQACSGKVSPAVAAAAAKWVRKCDAELAEMEAEGAPQRSAAVDAAVASAPASAEEAKGAEAPAGSAAPGVAATAPKPSGAAAEAAAQVRSALEEAAAIPRAARRVTHEWFQSLSHVTVNINVKGVREEQVKSSFSTSGASVDIALDDGSGSTVSFELDLYAEIVPESSVVKVRPSNVELRMKKANTTLNWPTLEASAAAGIPVAASTATASSSSSSSAPSRPSAYASKKNWDAIEKELEQDEEDKPEGDEALNKLFQDIYKNASDETRRAMVKSFQTSGGTVLSTNWDEVAKKDYESERPAPKGMEWRNWEGDKLEVGDDDV